MANSVRNDNQTNSRRGRVLLLLILFMLVSITSCIAGYILGQRTQVQTGGEIIDNIILTPVDPAPAEQLSLSGVVRYTDGNPVANTLVELHSTPRTTVTDANGYFFFHLTESGQHTLFVRDDQGREMASCPVRVSTDPKNTSVRVDWHEEKGYVLEVPVDVLLVEVEVVLPQGGAGPAAVPEVRSVSAIHKDGAIHTAEGKTRPENGRTVTTDKHNTVFDDGTVLLPDNRVLLNDGTLVENDGAVNFPDGTQEKSDDIIRTENNAAVLPEGTVLTPGGHVITGDNEIIHPDGAITLPDGTTVEAGNGVVKLPDGTTVDSGEGAVTLPNGTVVDPTTGTGTLPGGAVVDPEEGTVTLPGGTVVKPGEDTVILPGGTVVKPGEGTVTLPNGTVIDPGAGTITPPTTPAEPTNPDQPTTPGAPGTPGTPNTPVTPETPGGPTGPDEPDSPGVPGTPTDPEEPEEPEQPGGAGGSGGAVVPTTPGRVSVSSENDMLWSQNTIVNLFAGIDKLYPGVEGSYPFQVSNTLDETVTFTLTVTDDHTNAIPFVLTLKDADGKVVSPDSVVMPPDSRMVYTLHWQWPYESGDDARDTAIGASDDLRHTVTITIRAETAV